MSHDVLPRDLQRPTTQDDTSPRVDLTAPCPIGVRLSK